MRDFLACGGTPIQIGKVYGEQLKQEIKSNIYAFWKEVKAKGERKEQIISKAAKEEDQLTTGIAEEIEALAKGASIPYAEVLAYNIFSGTYFSEECTVIMAVGKASSTGNTIFLKNSDKKGFEHYVGEKYYNKKEVNVVLAIEPDEGYKFIGVAAAGSTGLKMGLNDKGVAVGSNIARTKNLTENIESYRAADRAQLLRLGLEKGSTAKEAERVIISRLVDYPMSTPGNIDIVDAYEGVVVEGSYDKLAVDHIKDNVAARSNMFTLLKELNSEHNLSSICRYARALELLRLNKDKLTSKKMIEFSMDHINGPGPNSICRHGDWRDETTLSSAVMEINGKNPEFSKIYVALGKPCHAWFGGAYEMRMDVNLQMLPKKITQGDLWREYYSEEVKSQAESINMISS